jgi:putative peptidoglycan lipid II flippase
MLLAGGALGTAFIPILSQRLTQNRADDPGGWRLASAALNWLLLAVLAVSIIMVLLAEPLVAGLVAPGFSPENQALTANLMRLTLLSTIIFSVSSLAGPFCTTATTWSAGPRPLIYNLGLILGRISWPGRLGSTASFTGPFRALGHLAVQLPALAWHGFRYRPTLARHDPEMGRMARLMGPRVLNIIVIQINFVVIYNLASRLGEGTVSALDYGWDLMQMPQTVIGSAIGIVLFPTLSELAAHRDIPLLRQTLAHSLRIILALSVPAMVGLMALDTRIVSGMLERGEFGRILGDGLSFAAILGAGAGGPLGLEVVNRLLNA